ncbi:MAG: hypothetical protein Q4D38_14770 [Planctomycetia bacterium]|nr:hypothetical protein [Planctomycetia bacterium]
MNSEYLLKLAADISLYNAKKYLRATGWVQREDFLPKTTIFGRTEPECPFDEVELPKTEEDPWYAQTLLSASERLAKFEQREIMDVMQDLTDPNLDRIRFRIIAKDVELGSVELDLVKSLFQGISAVCLTAIKDLEAPAILHSRVDNKTIQQMQRYARFGQTEHGSFTVNILIPFGIPETSDDSILFEDVQKTTFRDGIRNMMQSVARVQETILEGNMDEFVRENSKSPFVSANMLAAFAQIDLWEDTELEISAQWSPLVPCENMQMRLRKPTLMHFDSLARKLQTLGKDKRNRLTFSGYVMQLLGGEEDEMGLQVGDVKIKALSNEGDDVQTTIRLDSREWYDIAMQSHREKRLVMFTGDLVNIKTSNVILNVREFRLSSESKEQRIGEEE